MEETFGVLCRDRKETRTEERQREREGRRRNGRMKKRRETGVRHIEKDRGGTRGRRVTGPKDR